MKTLFILLIFMVAQIAWAQEIPQIEDLNVDDRIGEINSTLNPIPDSLNDEIIPNETATQLFSYMKWLFSDTSANELAGATLAPILINLYAFLFIVFTFASMWLTIRVLVFGWKLILFIIGWIIRLIELIPFFQ